MILRKSILIILPLILLMQTILFMPFLAEPFERDEGGYAYIAQRLLKGDVPYRDVYDHKPPAVYFIYATIFKLFGESMTSVRFFTLCYSLITTLAIFAVAYLLWGGVGGLLSAFLYAFFSGGPYIHGTSANTETFMVLPMVLALYCFLRGGKKWIFLAGVLSGLAVMIKQVAGFNFIALIFFISLTTFIPFKAFLPLKALKALTPLILGFLIFPLLFTVYFLSKNAFPAFFNALIFENIVYASRQVWVWQRLWWVLIRENSVLWLLALGSIVYILLRDRKQENLLLVAWGIFSVAGVFLGKSFFGHYFIQAIPGLVFLSTYALLTLTTFFPIKAFLPLKAFKALTALILIGSSLFILNNRLNFHFSSPEQISIKKYYITDFVHAPEIARYLKNNSAAHDTIFVWGAEPEIYFYSQRKAASKYCYYYPLFFSGEKKIKMLQQMMREIAKQPPKFIVLRPGAIYWDLSKYLKSNYRFTKKIGDWQIWEIK